MSKLCLSLIIAFWVIAPAESLLAKTICNKKDLIVNTLKTEDISFSEKIITGKYYLSFKARIASKWKSGACPALRIYVNNIPLQLDHLVNKGDYFRFRSNMLVPWQSRGSTWTLTYYNWNQKRVLDKFAHSFVFDISRLLVPGKNTIQFKNVFTVFKESHVAIKDIEILDNNNFPVSKYVNVKMPNSLGLKELRLKAINLHKGMKLKLDTSSYYRFKDTAVKPASNYNYPYKLSFNRNKALVFEVNENKFLISSKFSLSPQDTFSLGDENIKKQWESCKLSADTLSCENKNFTLQRKLYKHKSHLEIRDSFTNKTDRDLPIVVNNTINIPDLNKLREFRISGTPQPNFAANTNNIIRKEYALTPLTYLGLNNAGLGIVLQDDAYRNQYSLLAVDNKLHFADDMFYLKPRGSYTFVWKIFPTPSKGYYHFLNAVRADWKLYQNIPGLFGFIYTWKPPYEQYYGRYYRKKLDSPVKIKEFFNNTGISVPCLVPQYPLKEGGVSTLYGPEYLKVVAEGSRIPSNFMKSVKQAEIKLPFLMYVDIHLLATNKDKMLGSNEKWQDLYKATVVRDQFGKTVPYRSGRLYHLVPILGSKAASQILANIDYYLNKAGFNGLFLDEWTQSRQKISYAHSDGMSALLDENYKIKKKIGMIPILCKTFHVALAKKVLAKKGILFANQFDCTFEASQLPISHFAEPVDFEDYLLKAAQIGRTPLSLTRKRNPRAWEDVKGFLKQGVLTCYYAARLAGDHVLKKVYPITPKEIGPGYVIGEKKIITMLPGEYTFGRDRKLKAFIYADPKGLLKKTVTSKAKDGKQVLKLDISEGQLAVIIEK